MESVLPLKMEIRVPLNRIKGQDIPHKFDRANKAINPTPCPSGGFFGGSYVGGTAQVMVTLGIHKHALP
jgi:hypothetical protein